ncbi:polysaccharide deacetylase family protein [Salegentibacter sp. Hel_I_6]|uniref:polysaccharide deacetylase family protein n=1 Tax=Salegentibacter sp. Hel_I_6 TaxID=1250278 RepID=UPI000562AA4B|nr:polysaccharide deacetylase family protein [Salegentibacter sp. Hel_I_6]
MNNKSLHVLAYHTVRDSTNFEIHLSYLKKNYSVISVDQLLEWYKSNIKLPKKPMLITFDDGDLSVYQNALPLLKKYSLPAILFIVTNLINTEKPFWWDEIEYYLGKEEGNKKVWEVKTWPNSKREAFLEELRNNSSKPLLKYKQLTTAQLKEMQGADIMIANHSHTHPMFDQCTQEELESEIKSSIEILKDLGFTPDVFAYPNGNYSPDAENVLKKYGADKAYLFDHKINKKEINHLRISRLVVNDTTPLWKFKLILSGWHTRILPFTRFAGKLKAILKK